MRRVEVSSSNVVSVGYDHERLQLEVEFKGGGVYRYRGVSSSQYQNLLHAPSIGKYIHRVIKPNCLDCTKL